MKKEIFEERLNYWIEEEGIAIFQSHITQKEIELIKEADLDEFIIETSDSGLMDHIHQLSEGYTISPHIRKELSVFDKVKEIKGIKFKRVD